MALMVHNPFGQDAADFNEETSADRIGRRIRAIRMEKGLSQAELGEAMGLTADRIQKYENGTAALKGIYSGFVSSKDIPDEVFNYMGEI